MGLTSNVTQHFRASERPFLHQASDWLVQARTEYRPILTGFLNERERYLVQTLVNREPDVHFAANGGYPEAEMQRGLLYPEYVTPAETDFEIGLVEIRYPVKFATLQHRQVLGALLGSGIERNVIGDLITDGKRWQVITQLTMMEYLERTVTEMGRTKVQLLPQPLTERLPVHDDGQVVHVTLPSLRLDVVIATLFRMSRAGAKALVAHGKVRLNWFTYDQPDYELAVHDLISVRGFGRIKFDEQSGVSKKGKIKAAFDVIKNK
ncbi:YlmH/Sll1252 family protein [Fructilactobacillus ixorae]|uniref:YlmH/Sll1252 family protein n=1 Tax=Fructilactobacillus ixorae TaxID=1750535 RepID=A0ABY5C6H2_9LACO|nr:YlmH/Sll1252 family protein [Fructilactobacillus ixorae]USS92896.1 YlmH/Sll1252 family protein [Fructilactobacillus ixorae]